MKVVFVPLIFLFAFQGCAYTSEPKQATDAYEHSESTENQAAQTIFTPNQPAIDTTKLDTAILGAGCFWCVEAVYQELKGVHSVVSGYTGGNVKNPTYRQISYEKTGHAEVAQIVFDTSIISYEELLEVFWSTHDPTTLNRQGNDVGDQYRSAIFYRNESQKSVAQKSLSEVGQPLWNDAVVTEITALGVFYPAENYHQDYYANNPNQGYCRAIINPKLKKFREKFADKLKSVE